MQRLWAQYNLTHSKMLIEKQFAVLNCWQTWNCFTTLMVQKKIIWCSQNKKNDYHKSDSLNRESCFVTWPLAHLTVHPAIPAKWQSLLFFVHGSFETVKSKKKKSELGYVAAAAVKFRTKSSRSSWLERCCCNGGSTTRAKSASARCLTLAPGRNKGEKPALNH